MISSLYDPYTKGYACATIVITMSYAIAKSKANLKILLCPDRRLELVYVKLELLVI